MTRPTLVSDSPGIRRGQRAALDFVTRPYSAVQFLIALILMILAIPLIEELSAGKLIERGLISIVLLSAVFAIGAHRRMRVIACALVVPVLTAKWIGYFMPAVVPPWFVALAVITFATFVVITLLRFIVTARRVDTNVLCAAGSGYLMLGILWAFAYMLVARLVPTAFTIPIASANDPPLLSFNALYFSFCTITTLGCEFVPVARTARLLAMSEAVVGMFFSTILIARLVSMYSKHSKVFD